MLRIIILSFFISSVALADESLHKIGLEYSYSEISNGSDEKTSELSNFRLKAPEKMAFGKLFYFFINDYNDRHPENKIVYINSENEPHGWVFYRKPKWYLGMKYIDYARTVDSNGIKEDNVIICQRVD